MSSRPEHLVLVGMSPVEAAHEPLAAWATELDATVAFLQLGTPSLSAELNRLQAEGARTIGLVGIKVGRLGPGASWLRRIAAHWWREQGELAPDVLVSATLSAALDEARSAASTLSPLRGTEPGLTSAAWQDVPSHRHHVLVCWGPRCISRGADETAAALADELSAHGLGDDRVLVTNTGCQFPCNNAPLVTVHPDDVWYGGVDADAAREIVREHLATDTPVARLRLPRTRRQPS